MSESDKRWLRALIILSVVAVGIWVAAQVWALLLLVGDVLLLFFLAWLIAFILSPISKWLRARGISNVVSTLIVYLGLGVAIGLTGFLVAPIVVEQLRQLLDSMNRLGVDINSLIANLQNELTRLGLRNIDLTSLYGSAIGQFQTIAGGILQNTISLITGIASLVLGIVIVFILSFYITLDGSRVREGAIMLVPEPYRSSVRLFSESIDRNFGGFLRGQLLVGFLYGVLTAIVMWPANLGYSLVVSILAGIAMMIPFVGGFIALVPPAAVALVQQPASLWWVLLALLALQQVVLQVVSPRVMSQTVGIHPLLVFLALLLGAKFGGGWGAIFGIPVVGVLTVMARHLYHALLLKHDVSQEQSEAGKKAAAAGIRSGHDDGGGNKAHPST